MNVSEVQDTLYDWIVAETGLEVVWERANAHRLFFLRENILAMDSGKT